MTKRKDKNKMESTLAERVQDPGFFRELWQQARLVFRLVMDPEVPIYLKVLPFLAVVYLFLPVDLLPDLVPGLGQLDDITLLLVGAKVFIELAPQDVVTRYLSQIRKQDGYSGNEESTAQKEPDADVIEGIIIEDDQQ